MIDLKAIALVVSVGTALEWGGLPTSATAAVDRSYPANEEQLLLAHFDPVVMEQLNQAIRDNPDHVEAYLQRGLARNHLENYQGAIADFSEVIRIQPKNLDAYNYRGTIYYHLGEYQKALADYNQALKLSTEFPILFYNRGYVRRELGDLEGAIADFQRGASLSQAQGDLVTYQEAVKIINQLQQTSGS